MSKFFILNKKRMWFFYIVMPIMAIVILFVVNQKAFGQQPLKERLERIKKSKNYKNGKFHNAVEVEFMTGDAGFFKLMKLFFKKHKNTEPSKPVPVVFSNLHTLHADSAQVVWFGHSSYFIKAGNRNILVDPVFSKRASPVSFIGVTSFKGTHVFGANNMPDIDIMLITHDHYDHLDYKSIMALKGRTACYVVPLGVGQHLEKWGIDKTKILEFDWWDEFEVFPEITIVATPAQHFSGRGLVRNKTLWASFVVKTPQFRIFAGGDSGYGPHFKEIGEKYGPFDMAFLESGQYNNYWPHIHMMPEETVQASVDLQARVLMPVHWGKFKLAMHPWDEPIQRVSKKAAELGVKIATPLIGEPFKITAPAPEKLWINYAAGLQY